MKIADIWVKDGALVVLVDDLPSLDDLIWRKHYHDKLTLYTTVTTGGYASCLCADPDDQRGYDGQSVMLRLDDGTVEIVVDPWATEVGKVLNHHTTQQPVVDVTYMPFNSRGGLTLDVAIEELAARNGIYEYRKVRDGSYTFRKKSNKRKSPEPDTDNEVVHI